MAAHLRPHPDVLVRKVGDEVVLVHMGRNDIFALNPTGTRLWELLSIGCSPAEAIVRLEREFEAGGDVIGQEVDRLMSELERNGLLVPRERA